MNLYGPHKTAEEELESMKLCKLSRQKAVADAAGMVKGDKRSRKPEYKQNNSNKYQHRSGCESNVEEGPQVVKKA